MGRKRELYAEKVPVLTGRILEGPLIDDFARAFLFKREGTIQTYAGSFLKNMFLESSEGFKKEIKDLDEFENILPGLQEYS
jgi:hypothetical protein